MCSINSVVCHNTSGIDDTIHIQHAAAVYRISNVDFPLFLIVTRGMLSVVMVKSWQLTVPKLPTPMLGLPMPSSTLFSIMVIAKTVSRSTSPASSRSQVLPSLLLQLAFSPTEFTNSKKSAGCQVWKLSSGMSPDGCLRNHSLPHSWAEPSDLIPRPRGCRASSIAATSSQS